MNNNTTTTARTAQKQIGANMADARSALLEVRRSDLSVLGPVQRQNLKDQLEAARLDVWQLEQALAALDGQVD